MKKKSLLLAAALTFGSMFIHPLTADAATVSVINSCPSQIYGNAQNCNVYTNVLQSGGCNGTMQIFPTENGMLKVEDFNSLNDALNQFCAGKTSDSNCITLENYLNNALNSYYYTYNGYDNCEIANKNANDNDNETNNNKKNNNNNSQCQSNGGNACSENDADVIFNVKNNLNNDTAQNAENVPTDRPENVAPDPNNDTVPSVDGRTNDAIGLNRNTNTGVQNHSEPDNTAGRTEKKNNSSNNNNNNTETITERTNASTGDNTTVGQASNKTNTASSYAERILELVNVERAKEGLNPVALEANLTNAAQVRAIETKSSFSHTRPDGTSCFTVLGEFGIKYRYAGENIAYGQRSPEEVMEGWMNSPGHRANILNANFTKLGVGYYQDSNGVKYWSQMFISD